MTGSGACFCRLPRLLAILSAATAFCFGFELPFTPAPVPDCSTLQLASVHYMLQPSLAHVVCAYAAHHNQVSRGDLPLRAVVFSPGKHQLGNRVLELSSMMLLSMCSERALYVWWESPTHILRHAQPVLFDWSMAAVSSTHPDILLNMHAATKDNLWAELDSDDSLHSVLHYTLELGDYLLRVLELSPCAPLLTRFFEHVPRSRPHPLLVAPWLPALLRPSDSVLRKVADIWSRANANSEQRVNVVLVQLRNGGHTHSYKLLNETGEAVLFDCALTMPRILNVPCSQLAYFIAADKQAARSRASQRLSQQACSRVLHFEGPIVRSGDDLNREADEGGYSSVQVDDEGKPRTEEGIDLAWADWWVAAYAQHAVLTDRSSYAFSARLFGIGSSFLRHYVGGADQIEQSSLVSDLTAKMPITIWNDSTSCKRYLWCMLAVCDALPINDWTPS